MARAGVTDGCELGELLGGIRPHLCILKYSKAAVSPCCTINIMQCTLEEIDILVSHVYLLLFYLYFMFPFRARYGRF